MFMVLSSRQSHCESSLGSFDECIEQRQAATDPRLSQTTQAVSPPVQAVRVYTHHRHLLLLLSPKAYNHLPSHGR